MNGKPMSPRQKAAKLEAILTGHVARERRTLADIRNLGFSFPSVAAALAYAKAQATLARMDHEQTVRAVQLLHEAQSKKKPQFTETQLQIAARAREARRNS